MTIATKLLPAPRSLRTKSGTHSGGLPLRLETSGVPEERRQFLQSWFSSLLPAELVASSGSPSGSCKAVITPTAGLAPQGYQLIIGSDGVSVTGGDAAGLFYGLTTLAQLIRESGPELPCVTISDHPDFAVRGVMIDVARSKVPTISTLYRLVDLLASWKINHLELYNEHAFAYQNHRDVWEGKSPLTATEIKALDQYCQDRHVELVPNQNSFGHFKRWLQHPRYAHLADDPANPCTLCPTDSRALELLNELYDELLPCFSSRLFNVGCDETKIGQARSRAACQAKGEGRVYLDYLLQVYELVKRKGHTMLVWGDVIQHHPELVPELPRDIVVLEWGYESDHPFATRCARIAEAGVPFYVCPGTSTWNSMGGQTASCRANIINAAQNGLKHGAAGFINTDWGDGGHWQYQPVSYFGFAAGAAMSWCYQRNVALDVAAAVSLHAFADPSGTLGRAAAELGRVGESTGVDTSNGSPIFAMLKDSLTEPRITAWVGTAGIARARRCLRTATTLLQRSELDTAEAALVQAELRNTAAVLDLACRRGELALRILAGQRPGKPQRQELLAQLDAAGTIMHEHRRLWTARNRPGGLDESLETMQKLLISPCQALLDTPQRGA